MCFGCSKELSYSDSAFEYPQHMFWMRNKKKLVFQNTLIWRPDNNNNKLIQKIKLDFTHSVNLGPISVDIIAKKKKLNKIDIPVGTKIATFCLQSLNCTHK